MSPNRNGDVLTAYYNEWDNYAAQWLKNLISAGLIPAGDVDTRSINDVKAPELTGYVQCHFFAGIGGWPYALRLAGWPDNRPVWTGSCPCQPFSAAGARSGVGDERHLWPAWFSLIRERRPSTVFGEQVAAAIGHGWLDAVFTDLEAEGYACGAAVLPACGVGAPHIRQRLWFVADAGCERGEYHGHDMAGTAPSCASETQQRQRFRDDDWTGSTAGKLADAVRAGWAEWSGAGDGQATRGSCASAVADAARVGQQEPSDGKLCGEGRIEGTAPQRSHGNPWTDCEWIDCIDGKTRPAKPGVFPLAHGVSARVGKLRAAGNAIVPQIAAKFIEACLFWRPVAHTSCDQPAYGHHILDIPAFRRFAPTSLPAPTTAR